ncbi:MAG TPA: MFS transporter, partial [Thalassospira sp.]|nr:MFS transporter [Thalassospira sp.]
LTYQEGLLYLGLAVIICSFAALAVRFSAETQAEEKARFDAAQSERFGTSGAAQPVPAE